MPTGPPWFQQWCEGQNLHEFAKLVAEADLATFVEGSETPLTLFAPSNEAIRAVAHKLPGDMQLLRELVCVHITMGSLRCAHTSRQASARVPHSHLWFWCLQSLCA